MMKQHDTVVRFARDYLEGLRGLLAKVDERKIAELIGEFQRAYDEDQQIFIIGNGVSACTASHMACDLASQFWGRNPMH